MCSGGPLVTDANTLDRARHLWEEHAWQDAYEAFTRASSDAQMTGEDLERFAEAAWWTAHPSESVDALERAYERYSAEGNHPRAAYVALELANRSEDRLQLAQTTGWLRRAARLLESKPESVEHGYLELGLARRSDSAEDMMRHATAALDIGARFEDRDLQAYGLMCQGLAKVTQARIDEGMSLIDEATVAAVGGDLSPFATGVVYCMTIGICRDLADYRRAGEWTEATTRWCERQSISGFPGHCRVRRAEIIRLRGAFGEAEVEARRAVRELVAFGDLPIAGLGFNEIGEIRLRMGDLDGAEEAFERAHRSGNDAQPGLALVQLARGRTVAARSSIQGSLDEQPMELMRARLLPAAVEILLASHMVEEARGAAEELRGIAATYDAALWHASAHQALGAVLTAEGDELGAIAELRKAIRHWTQADMPFETAQARRLLASAHRAEGDEESAVLELRTARATFEKLGAALETARCDELLEAGRAPGSGRRVARTFMFTDIVGSTNLLETLGDEAWEDVVRWHNETLQEMIRAHRGEIVHGTGDGFFATFDNAVLAVSCAVAIEQRLAGHRREHGFAPPVRIGLHAGEATTVGDDYAGIGVHQAARVGALAGAGEVVVTLDTIEAEPIPFAVTDERTVSLRGIAQPVRVATVDWRSGAQG
jgi:class 3 adenylate cyclase